MSKRFFFTHFFTVMFNLSNLALYIDSPNEFPEHYGFLDHRLNSGNAVQKGVFAAIFPFVCIQAYCNQKTYSKTINRVLPKYHRETRDENELPPKRDVALSAISATYKAIVATTSLAALLKNQWNPAAAWTLAALCFPGNAASQFAIFATPFAKKYHWHLSYWPKLGLSHALALTYNLPNMALYFNAANGFLKHIKVSEHRLTDGDASWEYAALTTLGVFSLAMLISTQLTYSKKIVNVFTDPNEYSQDEAKCTSCTNTPSCTKATLFGSSMTAYMTAFYKTAVTSLSLITLTFVLTKNLPTGIAIASLCFAGNLLAQFSIFRPDKKSDAYQEFHGEFDGEIGGTLPSS